MKNLKTKIRDYFFPEYSRLKKRNNILQQQRDDLQEKLIILVEDKDFEKVTEIKILVRQGIQFEKAIWAGSATVENSFNGIADFIKTNY